MKCAKMDWFLKLPRLDRWAGITFLASKAVGFLALCSLGIANKLLIISIITGSLWMLLLIASLVLCILAWKARKEDKDRSEYERLKKKYAHT
jgi:hypothetical protein